MCIRLILPLFCEISEKKLRRCSRKFLCAKKRGSCATLCLIPLTKTWKHCATSFSRQQKNYLAWDCISPCMPTPKKSLPARKRGALFVGSKAYLRKTGALPAKGRIYDHAPLTSRQIRSAYLHEFLAAFEHFSIYFVRPYIKPWNLIRHKPAQ